MVSICKYFKSIKSEILIRDRRCLLTLQFFDCSALSIIELKLCLSSIQLIIFTYGRCLSFTTQFMLISHRNSRSLMGLLTLHFRHWLLTNGYPLKKFLI